MHRVGVGIVEGNVTHGLNGVKLMNFLVFGVKVQKNMGGDNKQLLYPYVLLRRGYPRFLISKITQVEWFKQKKKFDRRLRRVIHQELRNCSW